MTSFGRFFIGVNMDVMIDGIRYAPVTERPSKIGIAISTYNRHDIISRALGHQLKFLPAGALKVSEEAN